MRARTVALAAIPAVLAVISCGDDTSPAGPTEIDAPAAVAAVPTANADHRPTGQERPAAGRGAASVRPAPTVRKLIELPAVEVGGTIQLGSTCTTAVVWRTSDAAVATVVDGLVTGVAPGRARVSETCDGVTSSVSIEVVAAPMMSYAFDPAPPAEITQGDTGHFRVNVFRDGQRSRVTDGVTSSAPTVLRLDLEGDRWRYTGTGPGGAEIRVTQGGSRRLTHAVRVVEPWRRSGTGAAIIDLPTRITRIRIEGEYNGRSENFVVWCGVAGDRGGLLVNEIIGTRYSTTYSGVHSAQRRYGGRGQPCRELQIEHSSGVRWSITETTETAPRSGFTSASTGSVTADEAAVRRAREQAARRR